MPINEKTYGSGATVARFSLTGETMRKMLSLLLVCVILITGSLVMAKAKGGASITYRFSDSRSGYAEGVVTLTADTAGDYSLYWADDTAALDGWFAIASLKLKAGEKGSYSFSERVAIPAGATKLIAVKNGDDPTVSDAAAVFDIPQSKQFSHSAGERSYRFGALSDIHIDVQDGGKNVYYTNASKNFALALNVCADRSADFIITAGDQVTNASGTALEWLEYQRIIADSDYDRPIYEAIGNHEMRFSGYTKCDVACEIEAFIANTGLDGTAKTMSARKPYFEVTEPATGDHFIFMALENHSDPSEHDEFSDDQITWAEGLLKRYSGDGHKIFLIQHAGIKGYGAGDDHDDPAYDGSMNVSFKNNARFKQLIETYQDVIWFNGHTHVDFQDNVNYSDEGGTACKMFHIPSVANTTRLSTDAFGERELDRTFYDDTTQGYLVDVYTDATVLTGVNFYHNKSYPAYTYIVGETAETPLPTDAPTNAPTDAPTDAPTETAVPTSAEPAEVIGDANCSGTMDILDATAIQRKLASLPVPAFSEKLADVDGDGEVTILDATAIQRKLAGIITEFPAEKQPAATGASSILTTAKSELSACYQYASYPQYAALKRAYNANDASAAEAALSAFRELKTRTKLTTVYFADSEKFDNVRAYLWKSSGGKKLEEWPGQKPTYVKTNSYGQNLYAVTVDTARYDRIVFSNGEENKTADIPLTDQSGRVYYPISFESPYQVTFGVYHKNWYDDPSKTSTVYFTNTENWKKVYIYAWTTGSGVWPGVEMTFVRKSSSGKSIYKAVVPSNSKVIFTDGTVQTVDIPAIADGFGYYPYSKGSDGKWQVVEYQY